MDTYFHQYTLYINVYSVYVYIYICVCLDKHDLLNACLWEAPRRCAMWPRDPARGAFLRRSGAFPPFRLRESHGHVCKIVEFYRIWRDLPGFLRDLLGFDGFLIIFDMFFCVGFMIWIGFLSWDIVRFIGFQWVFDQILWSVEWI